MTTIEKLAAHLLEMASDIYSNHGCNDFDLSKVVPDPKERNAIVKAAAIWNGDYEEDYEYNPKWFTNATTPDYRMQDWMLMDFVAAVLKGEVDDCSSSR